jgi:ABC-2 type transport system ATP-binding protein
MSDILSISNLRNVYGDKTAVDGISFTVRKNEIVGLLGPNGAGKTTTINTILGVLGPTEGMIRINGIDLAAHRSQAIATTNFAAVYAPLPGNLTVTQNLRVFGLIYNVPQLDRRIDELLLRFDLGVLRDKKCGLLSSGEQTRACLAKAMLNHPRLLLLDEPTASLDPATAREIRAHIRDFASNGDSAVLWTSHNMHEVEDVCDRVMFMSQGKILLEGDPKTLAAEHGQATLEDLFVVMAREPLSLSRSPA